MESYNAQEFADNSLLVKNVSVLIDVSSRELSAEDPYSGRRSSPLQFFSSQLWVVDTLF
jgi:hypothetical protein